MPVPKNQPASTDALNFFNESMDLMSLLYARWQDEKEHENINEYLLPFRESANQNNITLIKFSKRPFSFTFSIADGRIYRMTHTDSTCKYQRIE
jgi:hypothetical protein